MRRSTDFIKKVKECNPQISDMSLMFLQKAYEAGIVEGRIREKESRMDVAKQVGEFLNEYNANNQHGIYELEQYQDLNWPFNLK